ncbi:lymphocyte antigen 6B-like [Xyrauchen texanus]|uniref:lymphocyte antigen 6B-like n=1 Tax=Xyrauchen texanus TaxID=154827 RepID=UPI002242819C|nr:lymphocyte antigen 6B-like [Xyrauchen texanus]
MNLRVSVVLLLIFLTGGHSLKCYFCTFMTKTGSCDGTTMTCPIGGSKCGSVITDSIVGSTEVSVTAKACAPECKPRTEQIPTGGTITTKCCDTDLCNGTDGIYKGSFLLLLSPLFFYILMN